MSFLDILLFILIISVLIFVHELGHFILAKLSGVWVQEFSLGMPPKLFTRKIGNTSYTLGLLPIGGYVKLYGEDEGGEPSSTKTSEGKAFYEISRWKKLAVLVGGVIMNYLLGILILGFVFATAGKPSMQLGIQISEVFDQSAAAEAGIQADNYIVGFKTGNEADFRMVEDSESFISTIQSNLDKEIVLQLVPNLERSKNEQPLNPQEIKVIPTDYFEEGKGSLGIKIALASGTVYENVSWYRVPVETVAETGRLVVLMIQGLGSMVRNLFSGIVPEDIAGPLGVAVITGEVAQEGFIQLLYFISLISINLAVVNILPLPALDGGRVFFILAEMILRRSLDGKFQQWIHTVGLIVLLILMAVVTVYDYIRFF